MKQNRTIFPLLFSIFCSHFIFAQSHLINEARFYPLAIALDQDTMILHVEVDTSTIDSITLSGIPYIIRENGLTDPNTELKLYDSGQDLDTLANDQVFTSEAITVQSSNLISTIDDFTIGYKRFDYTITTHFHYDDLSIDTFYHDYGLVIRYFDQDSISIPDIISLGDTVQFSNHAVQFKYTPPGIYPNYSLNYSKVNSFYTLFQDEYEFIGYNWLVPHHVAGQSSAFHNPVQNNVSGIGLSISDDSSQYGSSGALIGLTTYVRNFDLTTINHEVTHQWCSFIPFIRRVNSHWSWIKDQSSGFGGSYPYAGVFVDLVDIGNNEYAGIYPLGSEPNDASMNNIEMYLAGAYPTDSIQNPIEYFDEASYIGFATVPINGVDRKVIKLSAPKLSLDFVDVTDSIGFRVPDYNNSLKDYKMAGILVYDRFLEPKELAYFNHYYATYENISTYSNDFREISFQEYSKGVFTLNSEIYPMHDALLTDNSIKLKDKPIDGLFTIRGPLELYYLKLFDVNNVLLDNFIDGSQSLSIDIDQYTSPSYFEIENKMNSQIYLRVNVE